MKLYKSKKIVRAFRITRIEGNELFGFIGPLLTFRYVATDEWMARHKPEVDNYVVTYEKGYTSYNIQAVFDAEHTMLQGEAGANLGGAIDPERGWLYRSNKIVCAGEIEFWGEAQIDTRFIPIVRAHGGFVKELAPVEVDRIFKMLGEIHPKASRWLVVYSNGYVSVSAGLDFEEGYEPLTV